MDQAKASEGASIGFSTVAMVTFDVDGTIFRKPCLREAAHQIGLGRKWDQIDEMHERGRITLRDRLISHYKLLHGLSVVDILGRVSHVPIIGGVRETVEKLQGQHIRTILLSDLPDFVCGYLVERFGFEGYVASKVEIRNGVIDGAIEPLPDKRLGLRKYSVWTGIPLFRCVHVGDGLNDVPVFRVVRYSIALNSSIGKVKGLASHQMQTDSLLDVYQHLKSLS